MKLDRAALDEECLLSADPVKTVFSIILFYIWIKWQEP